MTGSAGALRTALLAVIGVGLVLLGGGLALNWGFSQLAPTSG